MIKVVIIMNKKVVVLGGGSGLSSLLRGLKEFPLDITAIVTVSDDGSSSGKLKKEFNVPAVGDLRRVLVSLSETEPLVEQILNYRFNTSSDLNGHTIGNLLLVAASHVAGHVSGGIISLSKILKLKGRVIPLTNDLVTLIGKMEDGSIVVGEDNITKDKRKIVEIEYDKNPLVTKEAIQAIKDAELIILSMGSLFTSIAPNLLCSKIIDEIDKSQAKIMYVCNMMTQPGETDDYKVSDHIKMINKYLNKRKVDICVVNNGKIDEEMRIKYETTEQKDPVIYDEKEVAKLGVKVISDDFVIIENDMLRHDVIKLGLQIFSSTIQ